MKLYARSCPDCDGFDCMYKLTCTMCEGKGVVYTAGTRHGDLVRHVARNTLYGAIGLVLLIASAIILWGGLLR